MNAKDIESSIKNFIENIRDRHDKSVLKVDTTFPEQLLQKDVAFPDKVKHLILCCDIYDNFSHCYCYNFKIELVYKNQWLNKYTSQLLKDIIRFNNLEKLEMTSVKLDMKLWKEFINNCTRLKEIIIKSVYKDEDWYKFDSSTLKELFSISTLKRVVIDCQTLHFPSGPSNIEELYLNDFEPKHIESFSKNLQTHKNLKILNINRFDSLLNNEEMLLKTIENCKSLENVTIKFDFDNTCSVRFRETLFQLPNLRQCLLDCCGNEDFGDRFIEDHNLIFPSIIHLDLYFPLDDEEIRSCKDQFPSLISLKNYNKELL